MYTLDDWITSSGKFPNRAKSPELTKEVRANAAALILQLNILAAALNLPHRPISSGFRPLGVNAAVGGAKFSGHRTGKAVDLEDVDNELKNLVKANPALLRRLGLMLEHPLATPTWMHIDSTKRTDRPNRIFLP